jgi:PAS domain S-box-containing protein
MRGSRKNGEREEQVRKDKKEPAGIEPIRPQTKGEMIREPIARIKERFGDILQNLSDLIWEVDENGIFTWCSGAAEDIFGVPARELIGKRPFDFMPAEEAQRVKNIIEEIFLKKEPIKNLEAYHEDKRGRRHWLCVNGIPVLDNKGTLKGYIGVYKDITSQKKAEESLRESELKFRMLADEAFDGIAIHDGQRIIEVNKAFGIMWGYTPGEAAGLRNAKLFAPECWGTVKKNIQSGYDKPYETVAIRKDGTRFTIEVAGKSIIYKGRTMRIATTRDITERKKAEERLKAERQRLYDVLETLPVMVCLFTPDYHVAFANRVFRQKFGEDNGRHCYDYIFGRKGPCEFCEAHNVLKTGKPHHWECTGPDGGSIIDVYDFPFTDTDGSPLILEMDIDITERKKAEQKLLEYQKQLKRLAAQLALAEERERRRIAGELHDHVSQSLALAKIKLDSLHSALRSQPLAGVIEDLSGSIEKAIQDTRTLTFDLSYPILYELGFEAAVVEWLNEQVRDKNGIAVEFADDNQPKPLDDDVRVLLFRNVRELLINCIKHANADRVRVGIRRINDSIEVTVEDNGVGFDLTEVKSMAARRSEFGLLSIRESLEELGGRFEIESKPGAGCKATMTAPLKGESRKKEE